MEDTFRVRVDKTFNSLSSSSSSSSQTLTSPSLWCLTDEEIEKRQWPREPDASNPVDDDDDDDDDNDAFLASNVGEFFFAAKDDKSIASKNNIIPNPNPSLNELDFRKEVEDDLEELDDNDGEGTRAENAVNECREVVCGEEDELDVKKSIGMDCTLDFELRARSVTLLFFFFY
ncbi:Porphobilinogen deaminase [Bienertia sinuspersici]